VVLIDGDGVDVDAVGYGVEVVDRIVVKVGGILVVVDLLEYEVVVIVGVDVVWVAVVVVVVDGLLVVV